MVRDKKKENRITVSLTSDVHQGLEAIAEDRDVSLSWVVRRAVSEYLAKQKTAVDGDQASTSAP